MGKTELRRELGLFDSISIVLGIVIGSSIFLVPNLIARALDSPAWILTVWIASGLLSFFGALAFAEPVEGETPKGPLPLDEVLRICPSGRRRARRRPRERHRASRSQTGHSRSLPMAS